MILFLCAVQMLTDMVVSLCPNSHRLGLFREFCVLVLALKLKVPLFLLRMTLKMSLKVNYYETAHMLLYVILTWIWNFAAQFDQTPSKIMEIISMFSVKH